MHVRLVAIIAIVIFFIGCSSTGDSARTSKATNTVGQIDLSKVDNVDISVLHDSFLNTDEQPTFTGKVLEVTGEVVAFSMTGEDQFSVTIQDGEHSAVCIFDGSISGQLGDGKPIQHGAELTIRGECYASGLFSSNTFTLDGCRIVSN